jgi:hypothetical protein
VYGMCMGVVEWRGSEGDVRGRVSGGSVRCEGGEWSVT